MKYRRNDSRGVALVVVLAMSALMVVLVTGLLTLSSTELSSSRSDEESLRSRTLADAAINLAISQLRLGTSPAPPGLPPWAWTSQPGAIRVHDSHGRLERLYKLYSSDRMSVGSLSELDGDRPANWRARAADFVDLNEPIRTLDGLRYPIVDPRAKRPRRDETVEGFDFTGEPAMPVRWLYVLQDATIGVLDAQGNFTGPKPATRDNPIVGRIAFWTDDESCKINVNTASEGVFWDTPRACSEQDRRLAMFQPARGEYQRYPGHPAQVCLSSVLFPHQRLHPPGEPPASLAGGHALGDLPIETARRIWRWSPGMSADASLTTDGGRKLAAHIDDPDYLPPASIATPAAYHLYHDPAPLALEFPAAFDRSFFLTARSSAPETTLYGTPRVALWPVHGATAIEDAHAATGIERATAFDRTIAFVSTVGGRKYFVQRRDAKNGWWDFYKANSGDNALLFHYLSRLTDRAVPGFEPHTGPKSFAEKYGTGLTGDRDQIAVSMLDYIRQTNMNDGNLPWNCQFSIICPGNPAEGYGQITPLSTIGGPKWRPGQPLADGDRCGARGFGRVMTISEVALIFTCRAQAVRAGDTVKIIGKPSAENRSRLIEPGDREIEAGILVEGFVPAQGWTDYRPYCSIALGGTPPAGSPVDLGDTLPGMSLNGQPLELPANRFLRAASTGAQTPSEWIAWGGTLGERCFTSNVITFKPVVIASGAPLAFSGSTATDGNGNENDLRLALYDDPAAASSSGTSGNADVIQVVSLRFPSIIGLPAPTVQPGRSGFTLDERLREAVRSGRLIDDDDVVQSLVPSHGDYRLLAVQRTVDANVFVPHPAWGTSKHAHSLREPWLGHRPQPGNVSQWSDGFIPGIRTAAHAAPDFPVSRNLGAVIPAMRRDGGTRGVAEPHLSGDFDNGVAGSPDGAYINRADDGELSGYAHGAPYFDAPPTNPLELPRPSKAAFSPNRLIPSAGMFGSLSTGARAGVPWQTLLFRPQPELNPGAWRALDGHYGWKPPRDHLWMDLFWMPIVEPYALSTPCTTAGKINLNHPLVPFSNIRRATAIHALLKAEKIMAIPDTASAEYKDMQRFSTERWRHHIDAGATLRTIDADVFSKGRVFLSATELCEHYLVPEGQEGTRAAMSAFWSRHRLTGDNTKERPYANLIGRLTTRSNVYRVHFIAQSIRQPAASDRAGFDPARDTISGEFAGDAVVERFIDPADPDLPDYAAEIAAGGTPPPLDSFYSWRITAFKQLTR